MGGDATDFTDDCVRVRVQNVDDHSAYPVRIEGELEPDLSRWLWVVKWALAIPHYIVLGFLWLTLLVLSVVAFFAILVTGRYPRGIFDFNVGVLRWTWRVAFYSYGALGTDRYPPFTLDDVDDYPARLDVEYPESLSRGLVLVKWWLLAIPHYIIVGIFLGGGSYAAARVDDWFWSVGFQTGLIGILVVVAGFALVFIGSYPRGIFDLVVGLDRWVARVAAYVLLMRDEYPPFRLDQGGVEESAAPSQENRTRSWSRTLPAARKRSTVGRVVLVVVGILAGIIAFGLLAGGCALVAVDQTQRDDDGFVMSPTEDFSSATYAIVSESADLDTEGAEWALDTFLGTVRIRSESGRAVFVGIAPAAEVDRYLEGVEHDVVTDFDGDPEYEREPEAHRPPPPGDETFWAESVVGPGEQTLDWDPEDGDWRVVVMNDDAARGVSSDMSIGAELDTILWIGIGLLVAGGLLAPAPQRRSPRAPVGAADTTARLEPGMEIGVFTVRGHRGRARTERGSACAKLMEEVELADEVGLDVFGVGEPIVPSSRCPLRCRARRRRSAHEADPVDERGDGAQLGGPDPPLPAVLDARSALRRSRGDAWSGAARSSSRFRSSASTCATTTGCSRRSWRSCCTSGTPEPRSGLRGAAAAGAGAASRVGRRRRHAGVGGARGDARPADGARDHRRAPGALQAVRRAPSPSRRRSRPRAAAPQHQLARIHRGHRRNRRSTNRSRMSRPR